MLALKEKFDLQPLRGKILITFLFGCLVALFSLFIARFVFRETFSALEEISQPNPKLTLVNSLLHDIHRLDQMQKLQLLASPAVRYTSFQKESDHINALLDTLADKCKNDQAQTNSILRMQNILRERDALFRNYLEFHKSVSFSKDMRHLSNYISQNIQRSDSNIVRSTTKKNTTTTTLQSANSVKGEATKKETFFKRIFSRKKKSVPEKIPDRKTVTHDLQITVDTLAIARRDSFMNDVERAIFEIEKNQSKKGSRLMSQELKLGSASAVFMDELQQLLSEIQAEEVATMQKGSESLNAVFTRAFYRVGIIVILFFLVTVVLILLMFGDLSQSNKNRLQLIAERERAEQLEQSKHRFLTNMSHEIRTPLQSIIGYSEQLKLQHDSNNKAVEAIYRSSSHLLQIVNEVLDYSRIVSGKFRFEAQDFDMPELLAEVADVITGLADQKELGFKIESSVPHRSLYRGDPVYLKQILYNLLGNAVKFTETGQVTFNIATREINSKKTEFTFEIKDTGVGMTEEEVKLIFKPFEQAGNVAQHTHNGTGLGLSIAKTLAEMQGGRISVHSKKNQGSVFRFIVCYMHATSAVIIKPEKFISKSTGSAGKVVLVDDDTLILQLCDTILNKYNIPHGCYSSGETLLSENWDPATRMVIMDMKMPVMDGYELYKQLRPRVPFDVKFIALTAQALPDEKTAILAAGFDKVLLKPFREKDLLQLFESTSSESDVARIKEIDVLDLKSLEVMCAYDQQLLKQTLNLFAKETRADLKLFQDGVRDKNTGKISYSSHRLSAKVGQLGFRELANRLRQVEKDAEQKADVPDVNFFMQLEENIYSVIAEIDAHLY